MWDDNVVNHPTSVNLIGAICIICAGLLTIITTVFANGIISTILMLVYIILASVIAVIYSKKEYDIERKKEGLLKNFIYVTNATDFSLYMRFTDSEK